MSSSASTRNAAHNERRTSATQGAQPRVSSTREEARARPGVPEDVSPRDSASNAGNPRHTSGSYRANGSAVHTINERLNERHKLTLNEGIQFSSRGPLKSHVGDKENAAAPKPLGVSKLSSMTPERKEKPAPRRLYPGFAPIRVHLALLMSQQLQRRGFLKRL